MRRIDGPASPNGLAADSLARHHALERLADCTSRPYLDPEEISWALESLSRVIENRLARDAAWWSDSTHNPTAERVWDELKRVQDRLRQAIAALRQRCVAHTAELRLRVAELADLLAEYDRTIGGVTAFK